MGVEDLGGADVGADEVFVLRYDGFFPSLVIGGAETHFCLLISFVLLEGYVWEEGLLGR